MARGDFIGVQLTGLEELGKLLHETPKAVFVKAVVPAARSVLKGVLKSAKSNIRAQNFESSTGLLFKSMGIKVKAYKRGRAAGTVWAGVGPRQGHKSLVIRNGVPMYSNPVNYAHLLEFGHNVVRNKKVVGHARPRPFLRPAWEANKSVSMREFLNAMAKSVPREIEKQARKAGLPK